MPADRIPFYENEQFATADLNALSQVVENYLEDVPGFDVGRATLSVPYVAGIAPGSVIGGLTAAASGTTALVIQPGAMLTSLSAPDNPNLSGRYLAINRQAATVPLPTPVADTWYIIAGRPVLVDDAPVSRRVWDVDNVRWQNPSPSLVKRRRASMAFDVIAGVSGKISLSNALADGAVPLWAVFRPSGGGAINAVDMRPLASLRRPVGEPTGAMLLQNLWRMNGGLLDLAAHAMLDDMELHVVGASLDPLTFKDPTSGSPSAHQWWYLYLAPFARFGCTPRNAQQSNGLIQQGLVCFSTTPPYDSTGPDVSRRNSAAITVPVPYNDLAVPLSGAICIAQLRRNAGNTAWLAAQGDGDYVNLPYDFNESDTVVAYAGPNTFNAQTPIGARVARYQVGQDGDVQSLEIRDTAGITIANRNVRATGSGTVYFELDVPLAGYSSSLQAIRHTGSTGDTALRLIGYRF